MTKFMPTLLITHKTDKLLEGHTLVRLTQEEIANPKAWYRLKKFILYLKPSNSKAQGPVGFSSEFYQTSKEQF